MELRAPPQVEAVKSGSLQAWSAVAIVLLGVGVGAVGGAIGARAMGGAHGIETAQRNRDIASELKAAGAEREAALLYEHYLAGASDLDAAGRAGIELSLGSAYLEAGQYETALRWFYEAKADDKGELANSIGKKIVHVLERMGRLQAARAALDAQTQLSDGTPARASNDVVVAQLGADAVYKSDVVRAMDDLPPEMARRFASVQDYLKQYVADELLWRKAQKLEYDQKPEVLRQLETLTRRLAVQAFIGHEVVEKVSITDPDLHNFWIANKEKYTMPKPGEEPVTLDHMRPRVEHDYRMAKVQSAYGELMDKELQQADVKMFPERLQATK